MTPRETFYTVEPLMQDVTKEEFYDFIEKYPRLLIRDVYAVCDPPYVSYNDFELANRWPHSVVASTAPYSDDPDDWWYEPEESRRYRIMVNYQECFNSKTGYIEKYEMF